MPDVGAWFLEFKGRGVVVTEAPAFFAFLEWIIGI